LKLTEVRAECARSPLPIVPVDNGDLIISVGNAGPSPSKWTRRTQRLREDALVFYFAFKNPRMPWYARLVAVCTAGYLLSPVQLIPSYIPVIGFLDDFLVLFLGLKLLRKIIPHDVLADCRQRAAAVEARRKEKIKSAAARASAAVIVSLWLLTTVVASVLIAKLVFR